MSAYRELYWTSPDGLRLHARDYPGDATRPPILCLPGLTRNARDYADIAARLAGGWRVLAIDLRGRGGSEAAKDAMTYDLDHYLADVQALLVDQRIDRFMVVGTALGGVVAMALAAAGATPDAAVLNDVGPVMEATGLARIKAHVGRASSFPTWMHAARAVAETHRDIYPAWGVEDWLDMAKRLYRITSAGRIVLDYDLRIAEPLRAVGGDDGPDPWGSFDALAGVPTLIVRGGRSDVLSATTAVAMQRRLPQAELVTVEGVGHAPTLSEPIAYAAIERLLAQVA